MRPAEIRQYFIDPLAAIFGQPKNADALAWELAKHIPAIASPTDLEALVDQLISSRKGKGFPPASELIAAVKRIVPAAGGNGAAADVLGGPAFDGEIPMIWILAADPRWRELCRIAIAMEPRDKQGRRVKPYPMTSKYAQGLGRFFRIQHVRGVPLTGDERQHIGELYGQLAEASP
jgi:hypothetical protein